MKFNPQLKLVFIACRYVISKRILTIWMSILFGVIVLLSLNGCKQSIDQIKVESKWEEKQEDSLWQFHDKVLEAEMIVEHYDIDTLQMGTYLEALTSLGKAVPEFNDLERSLQCRVAMKKVREKKCSVPIKYLSDIVRKRSFGQLNLDKEGKITVNGPRFASFKKQVNRLNGLIVIFNSNRQKYCDMHRWCDPVFIGRYCGTLSPADEQTYQKCEIFYTVDRYKELEDILAAISTAFNDLEKDLITDEQVKAVMDSELDKLEKDNKEDSEEVEDEKVTPEIDSTTK